MKRYFICILFFISTSSLLFGQNQTLLAGLTNTSVSDNLWYQMVGAYNTVENESLPVQTPLPRKKNPTVGIMMSALVPGTGEMYAGSWIKGAVLLSLEVFLWINVFKFTQNGEELEDDFQAYADSLWSEERWLESGNTEGTHTLPNTKTQQYYEMIGKYDQFASGWDDYETGGPLLTVHRNHYETMRDDSNQAFIKASYCSMIVLGNHVLSAFDTAFTIRSINRRIEAKMRMTMLKAPIHYVPGMSLSLNW